MWLSFIQKRLKIAKKLLNPKDSVLIVTIDEREYLHLGCLLEELFSECQIQMVSILINRATVAFDNKFGRSDEYAFIVYADAGALCERGADPSPRKAGEDEKGDALGVLQGIHRLRLRGYTRQALRSLLRPGHFGQHLKKHNLKKIRFHDLRHSCASVLLAQGVPMKQIQEWLGHSDMSTTANIYSHLDAVTKAGTGAAMSKALG